MSAFGAWRGQVWPYRYAVDLSVGQLHGGVPQDPRVIEGWIRSKLLNADQRLVGLVQEAVKELGYTQEDMAESEKLEEALTEAGRKQLNGFKRDLDTGELYIEGRAVKAMLKESANIAYPWVGGKGEKIAGKGVKNAFKEHVFVEGPSHPDRLFLGVKEPDDVDVRFVTGARGQRTIAREEYVDDVTVSFFIDTDLDLSEEGQEAGEPECEMWGKIMLTAEKQGLGASRSQGYGTFVVEKFERV